MNLKITKNMWKPDVKYKNGDIIHYGDSTYIIAERHNINNLKFSIMSKKVFALVSGIVGGLQTIGVALVTYKNPEYATAINSAIVIAGAAIIEICNLFVKTEE